LRKRSASSDVHALLRFIEQQPQQGNILPQ
jgi:hypothetical protein